MPLLQGKSKEAFSHNVKAELKAGKPLKQALAIAYSTKRRAAKKYAGGMVGNQTGEAMDRKQMIADMMEKRRMKKMYEGGMVYPDVDYDSEMSKYFEEEAADPFAGVEAERKPSDRKAILSKVMDKVRNRHMGK